MLGYNPEMEELQLEVTTDKEDHGLSSAASLSDTTDPEEAGEIDELLNPGYPVYFNCAMPKKTHTLQVRPLFKCHQWWIPSIRTHLFHSTEVCVLYPLK